MLMLAMHFKDFRPPLPPFADDGGLCRDFHDALPESPVQLPISLFLSCIRQSSAATSSVKGRCCHHFQSDLYIVGIGVAPCIPPCHTCRLKLESKSFFELRSDSARSSCTCKLSWLPVTQLFTESALLSDTKSYQRCSHFNLQIIVLGSVVQVFISSRDF